MRQLRLIPKASLLCCLFLLLSSAFSGREPSKNGVLVWEDADWADDGTAQVPLGNGDVTAGVWVSNNTGDFRILMGSSSAFDENRQPVHHGAIRIALEPPLLPRPSSYGSFFQQTFDPSSASLLVETTRYTLRAYVDVNTSIFRVMVDSNSDDGFSVVATLEPYRRFETSKLGFKLCGPTYDHFDNVLEATDLPKGLRDTVTWYHENPSNATLFEETMRGQGVDAKASDLLDPFRGRIFGGSIYGKDLERSLFDNKKLTGVGLKTTTIQVAVTTEAPPSTPESWIDRIAAIVRSNPTHSPKKKWRDHLDVWESLWGRSYVILSARNSTMRASLDLVNAHVVWDRYLTLIQGRKALSPIKFNGQAFIANNTGKGFDYRQWGADYWWQNTRQPYYNCLMQGDVDVLDTLLRFYHQMLPYCQARTVAQFKDTDKPLPSEACFYPETSTAFGTYSMDAWGCNSNVSRPYGAPSSPWIRFHWSGGLELALLILDRYQWTKDQVALQQRLPIIQSVLSAFMNRFPKGADGVIDMFPAQSLETWQCNNPANRSECVTNPTPDIAGLIAVLSRAITLSPGFVSEYQKQEWEAYLKALPKLPIKTTSKNDGEIVIMPGEQLPHESTNTENTELYTVHPYRIFGVGKGDLEMARATYRHRRFPCNKGWCQDIIDAAFLNLTSDLARQVEERVNVGPARDFRFPGFADHFQDYEPSLDHFATLRTALNYMLLSPRDDGDGTVWLFPGFPSDLWDVEFQLHGPNNTVINAACRNGRVVYMHVDPLDEAWRVRDTGNCHLDSNLISDEKKSVESFMR